MDDHSSGSETPLIDENGEVTYDKQIASLNTYLDALPYKCESVEEMQAELENIIGKIYVCAKSKNWVVLSTWDGMLQCWLLMRYPMQTSTRAKLVRIYYELCLLPGVDARTTRNWADMVTRLIDNKPNTRRKLEPADLQLPWRPLWRLMQRELWPKKRAQDGSRNVINILLYIAEHCKRYFAANEIPAMLETFIPLVTQDSILTMIPVITSFLPPVNPRSYIPAIFKLWQAFNSMVIDDRCLEFFGELAEEFVDSETEWKDVGIWTEEEWVFIAGKMLNSMNVPVGGNRASGTSMHADAMGDRQSLRIKKTINRYHGLAKLVVYSITTDGAIRSDSASATPQITDGVHATTVGLAAGSRALDSLDRLITSTESFFHPSNSGVWTIALTTFVQRLVSEFSKRVHSEKLPGCEIPVTRRITTGMRRTLITILRTPTLLAMFSKDPMAMGAAQASLHTMALIQPDMIMPDILERAYGGLEVVNETHRTTAVLSALSLVALPLVSEKMWLGGQKHIVPLLEMAIPGIDLNDPGKTLCSCMFVVSVVQLIKIGDISMQQSGFALSSSDTPAEEMMDVDEVHLPDGTEQPSQVLDRQEERVLVRESTAGFADWAVSLFRRVFALYENLPEEGGRRQTTGGKQEETVLKSIKSMLDVVCLHLSEPLFDLILKIVYDYATTNAKANSVRAFGQLVACLARVHPGKVLAKFMPFCVDRIEEELTHGASSVRTTSSHAASPSDTTLHWNISILRGCLGYGGPILLKQKDQILHLVKLLVDKTLSERGFSGTGRLLTRLMHTLSDLYPLHGRYVNDEEWNSEEFDRDHNLHWGRLYEAKEVKINWHVASSEEIDFVIKILDSVSGPALDKVESLLLSTDTWDNVARNDFCRNLHAVRSLWSGLPTIIKIDEQSKDVVNPCIEADTESDGLLLKQLSVKAGFALTDPKDPRYQAVLKHRLRFGEIVSRAAELLQAEHEGEDHIDAVMATLKAIDIYSLEYGMTRSAYDSLRKNYAQARDLNRVWPRQKTNSRIIFVKRAQVYHSGRMYMNTLYRRRTELDDKILRSLAEFSVSTYTRIRRQSQAVMTSLFGYYIRSTRFVLPSMFDALASGSDPDRMKGALYVLWGKGTASYAFSDPKSRARYLISLLECHHQEKPSIQKLVLALATDCLSYLTEEGISTEAYDADITAVVTALDDMASEIGPNHVDRELEVEVQQQAAVRVQKRQQSYSDLVGSVLKIAAAPTTHWRYVLMAVRFLAGLLRRDTVTTPELARFFAEHAANPHPTIRHYALKAVVKLTWYIKVRTYATSKEELWLENWTNPLQHTIEIGDPAQFMKSLNAPIQPGSVFVDKVPTGFIAWTPTIEVYTQVSEGNRPEWEAASLPTLEAIESVITSDGYCHRMLQLWSQESSRAGSTAELRSDHSTFIKSLALLLGLSPWSAALSTIEPMMADPDKYKQRASAELLAGLLRGSKHWSPSEHKKIWDWGLERLAGTFNIMKPDTLPCWEGFFSVVLDDLDPRRNQRLVDWMLSLPLDFHGNSAFDMNKTLTLFGTVVDCHQRRISDIADKYVDILFDNANTGYAEMRSHIAQNVSVITTAKWQPWYPSVDAFLRACVESSDPLRMRQGQFTDRIAEITAKFPEWKEQRLPPPRTNQSEYDKVGLTLLQCIWIAAHGQQATLMFPYAITMLPEILRMSELNDSSELQLYSAAVLYVMSAVHCPSEYIQIILDHYVSALRSSTAWRIRLNALPTLVVFFYRNLLGISSSQAREIMDALLDCLSDENVEVREMASKALSGVVRCSQRQSIVPLKNRFVDLARKSKVPSRRDPGYADATRSLHSAILGLCALIESYPYTVETWMPPLTDVLAIHATDPPPISTTIRKCASEFKKTHQDTWHKDQNAFNEDQLQNLSTMLVGTSYYA